MKIDAIDVYWMRLPLAFVWKTSYADQSVTDTILVRMEGGGHEAWGESCPPFIPGYSAEHTLAVFHTLREHMVPRIIGQDIETARGPARPAGLHQGQPVRAGRARHRLVGAGRQAARRAAAPRPRAAPATGSRSAPTSGSRTRSTS